MPIRSQHCQTLTERQCQYLGKFPLVVISEPVYHTTMPTKGETKIPPPSDMQQRKETEKVHLTFPTFQMSLQVDEDTCRVGICSTQKLYFNECISALCMRKICKSQTAFCDSADCQKLRKKRNQKYSYDRQF